MAKGRNPHSSPEARHLWTRACNFHRGSDRGHKCGNPTACERVLAEARSIDVPDGGWP